MGFDASAASVETSVLPETVGVVDKCRTTPSSLSTARLAVITKEAETERVLSFKSNKNKRTRFSGRQNAKVGLY